MDAAGAIAGYGSPLVKDEKLRREIAAAIVAGSAARQRVRKQMGLTGLARRLGADPVLRAQVIEVAMQLQAAQKRAKRPRTHKLRTVVLLVGGGAIAIATVPATREKLVSVVRARQEKRAGDSWPANLATTETTSEEPSDLGGTQSEGHSQTA